MDEIWSLLQQLLGVGAEEFTWYQVALRAAIIYVAALSMMRIGERRFLAKNTAFDVLLGIILGSVASRAINGSSALFATVVAGFVLVALHWLTAAIAFRFSRFGALVKGDKRLVVQNGEILWDAMRASHLTENDLMSQIRREAETEDLTEIESAYLERSGQLSIIRATRQPKVVEVAVREGVQTVRIEIDC